MRCRKVMALLAKDGFGEHLPDAARRHLAECPNCSLQVRLLQETEALLRAVAPVDEPPFFTERFLAKLEQERTARSMTATRRFAAFLTPSRRWKLGLAVALAAAHLLASAPFSRTVVTAPEAGARYTAQIAPKLREGVVAFAKELLGTGPASPERGKDRRSGFVVPEGRGMKPTAA